LAKEAIETGDWNTAIEKLQGVINAGNAQESETSSLQAEFWRKAKNEVIPRGVPPVEVRRLADEAFKTGDWDAAMKKLDELLSLTLFGTNR